MRFILHHQPFWPLLKDPLIWFSMLPSTLSSSVDPLLMEAKKLWYKGHNQPSPVSPASLHQKSWDLPRVKAREENLLSQAPDAKSRARLLAASTPESGAWLNVLPLSSARLRMCDNTIHVAIGLRLGTPLCQPHMCVQCGVEVN